jgi:hypothetical protein
LTRKNAPRNVRARPPTVLERPRINWRQLLADLKVHGCSGYRVTVELGVGWSTVQSWRRMKDDPGYGYGRALILLHSRHCGAALTFQRLTEADIAAYNSPP